MAREHGSRILNWWRRLKTCDRLALCVAFVLAVALIRDVPVSSDDGSTAAWDAPPQPYDATVAKQQLWGGSNATRYQPSRRARACGTRAPTSENGSSSIC